MGKEGNHCMMGLLLMKISIQLNWTSFILFLYSRWATPKLLNKWTLPTEAESLERGLKIQTQGDVTLFSAVGQHYAMPRWNNVSLVFPGYLTSPGTPIGRYLPNCYLILVIRFRKLMRTQQADRLMLGRSIRLEFVVSRAGWMAGR